MQKRKTRLIALAVGVLIASSVFAGCANSGKKPAGGNADSKPEEKKVKLTWWTHQRHDMDYMKEMIAKFMSENKNTEIEYNIMTENYPQNLEMAFSSGQSPDIFSMRDNAKYYVDRKMAEPLDGYITPDIKKRFDKFLNVEVDNTVDGKLYSLPNSGVTFRLVYNKDLFKKANLPGPPKTIDEMVEYAKKLTEVGKSEGAYGFAMNLKNPTSAFTRSMDQIAYLSGINAYNFKTGNYEFEPMIPIVNAFKKMYNDKSMFPGVEGLDIDPLRSQFAEGKIGMYISGNWEVGVYKSQFPAKIDWAAAPVPTINGTKGKTQVTAGKWQGISSKSENKDRAWKVLEWFYRDEVLVPYHEKGLGFSVVPSVVGKVKDSTDKGVVDFKINSKIDAIWPATPTAQGLKIDGKTYYDIFAAVILGAEKIENAVKDLNKRYNDSLEAGVKDGKVNKKVDSNFDPSKL